MKKKATGRTEKTRPAAKSGALIDAFEKQMPREHICLIYNNQEEQFAAAIPYMRIGLERGEKCVYIADDNTAAEVLAAMRKGGIDVDAALKKGALQIISKRDSYLRSRTFDPDEMIRLLKTNTHLAKREGYKALRVTGEMTWMLGAGPGVERAMEYEAKLNRFFPENDCQALCQYSKKRFSAALLTNVIYTHPKVVFGGAVCKNYYYVPVDEFLKGDKEPMRSVDRLLHNLVDREQNQSELEEAQRIGRIGSWNWDAATDSVTLSDSYRDLLFIDPERPPKSYAGHLNSFPSESAKLLDAAIKKTMKTGEPFALDLSLRKPDGTEAWITARGEAKRDERGGIVGFRGTAQDVTARKRGMAENARIGRALKMLSATNKALIHAADEETLLNTVKDIIVTLGGYRQTWIGYAESDARKTVRIVTQAGMSAGYLKNLNVTWADEERGRGPTGMAVRTGKTQICRDFLTDPRMRPWREEAKKSDIRSSIALPFNYGGKTFGALAIYSKEVDAFTDAEIPILEELADDLAYGIATARMRKRTEDRMKEIDQMKNKFIQIVSHQLRTPLSAIRWNLELLFERKRGKLSSTQEEILRGVYEADLEVVSRIDDLIISLDIEERRLRLDSEKAEVTEMIRSTCEEKLQASALKRITYKIVAPEAPLPPVNGDMTKIRDVIARLIENAITYTQEAGHITVRFFPKDGMVRFEISDTGIGVPDVEKPRIFDRFYRGWKAATMKPDASGLGLFIAKSYVEAHQGTIGFSSVENKGSTFWFELPIADRK